MSYESRAYDNAHGDPVAVLVATGTHDVSRIVQALHHGNVEQYGLAEQVIRQVKRHNGGQAALRLLRDHGGPDFTDGELASMTPPTDSFAFREDATMPSHTVHTITTLINPTLDELRDALDQLADSGVDGSATVAVPGVFGGWVALHSLRVSAGPDGSLHSPIQPDGSRGLT